VTKWWLGARNNGVAAAETPSPFTLCALLIARRELASKEKVEPKCGPAYFDDPTPWNKFRKILAATAN
jgi:hypothetical protein